MHLAFLWTVSPSRLQSPFLHPSSRLDAPSCCCYSLLFSAEGVTRDYSANQE